MKTFFGSTTLDESFPKEAIVAIGNFDGVHLGTKKSLKGLRKSLEIESQSLPTPFSPHPTLELRPESPLRLLMTYAEKRETLAHYGVNFVSKNDLIMILGKSPQKPFFMKLLLSDFMPKGLWSVMILLLVQNGKAI